ncbi:MAG: hypothetical protein HN341_02925 [Verrucomicrobia bacterium]|nr:hypothetical protein [Verrucomicrobiota bacterium]
MRKFIAVSVVALAVVCAQAETIVQWGSESGETDIVTADQVVANVMQTTWDGDTLTPTVGEDYYPNAGSVRTPIIYGAGSIGNEEVDILDGSPDSFRTDVNVGSYGYNYKGMLVWKDLLGTGRSVTDFAIAVQGRAGNENSGTIRWLVQEAGQWYISSQTYAYDSNGYSTHAANISSLSWNEFTPFNSGTATIGASASPELDNVTAVGFYFDVSTDGISNFANAEVKYFKCDADYVAPPPSLVQWGSDVGETDIVAVDQGILNLMQTTWDGDLLTPTPGVNYYPNAASERTPNIYGAGTVGNEEVLIMNSASADSFSTIANVGPSGNYKGMLVWKDFLESFRKVGGFCIIVRGPENNNNAVTVRWLVEQDDQWYISAQTYACDSSGYAYHTVDISAVSWKLFTPFASGTAVIGADATPTLSNATAAGFYFDATSGSASNFAGVDAQYFKVTQASAEGTVISIH